MSKNINIRHIYETRKLKKKGHTNKYRWRPEDTTKRLELAPGPSSDLYH